MVCVVLNVAPGIGDVFADAGRRVTGTKKWYGAQQHEQGEGQHRRFH